MVATYAPATGVIKEENAPLNILTNNSPITELTKAYINVKTPQKNVPIKMNIFLPYLSDKLPIGI